MRHIAGGIAVCSCLLHLVCCGLPMLTAFSGAASLWGISVTSFGHPAWLEDIEFYIPFVAGVALFVSGYLSFRHKKTTPEGCGCPNDRPAGRASLRIVFYISCILFALNVLVLLLNANH